MNKCTFGIAALVAAAGTASAQYSVNLGSLFVDDLGVSVDLIGGAIPAASYTSYSVSLDWVAGAGGPWQNEAIWAFTDVAFFPSGTPSAWYADPGASPDAASSGSPATLTWSGYLSPNYMGGDSLWFNALQTYTGSDAMWNNIQIDLGFDTVTAPTAMNLGTNPNTTVSQALGAGEVQWFSFDLTDGAGSSAWSLSLAGSTNTGGSFGDNDTEIGLYDALGTLIASNDDVGGGDLTSLLDSVGVGSLADGTYYIAAGGFNTTFNDFFDVTSTSTAVGTNVLTATFVPAPGSLALLGLAGLSVRRRR